MIQRQDRDAFPELKTFMSKLVTPEALKSVDPINLDIDVTEYRKMICKWKERTSTSPSGRHLGVYRALLDLPQVTRDICSMLNVVIRTGIIPSRWCTAISVMLEKDPGGPRM